LKLRVGRGSLGFLGGAVFQNGVLLEEKGCKKEKRVVVVKNNQGFGFNGGGGGGGRDDGATARLLGNIAVAIGLTYLSVTGQLGWILDAIVSIWVLFDILSLGFFCSFTVLKYGSACYICIWTVLSFNLVFELSCYCAGWFRRRKQQDRMNNGGIKYESTWIIV